MSRRLSVVLVNRNVNETIGSISFQLLGFDFMIDEDLRPWLIEVNSNPCIEESSPLLGKLLPDMLSGCLALCVDPVFRPRKIKRPANEGEHKSDPSQYYSQWSKLRSEAVRGFDYLCCMRDPTSGLGSLLVTDSSGKRTLAAALGPNFLPIAVPPPSTSQTCRTDRNCSLCS
jgi:hypothetical protein